MEQKASKQTSDAMSNISFMTKTLKTLHEEFEILTSNVSSSKFREKIVISRFDFSRFKIRSEYSWLK